MIYYFDMGDENDTNDFYDKSTIRDIRVYPASPEIESKIKNDPHCMLWPVYDCNFHSWEPVDCKDINEAYSFLLEALNTGIFERINDI